MGLRLGPGPVFAYEWLRATRRWTHHAHRSLIVSLVLFGFLLALSEDIFFGRNASPDNLARFGEVFYRVIVVIELTAVLLAAPTATAGAVCLDRSRGTLEHVLVTDLSDSEIVLGKLGARLIPVLGLIAATLPVLAISTLLGGIDPLALVGLLAVTIGCAVVAGSLAMALSLRGRSTQEVLITTYMIMIGWIAAPVLLRFASYLATGSPGGIAILDIRPWLIWVHPYVLAFAPYDAPGTVTLGTDLGFLAGCLILIAPLVGLTTVRLRVVVATSQSARAARCLPRFLGAPSLFTPSLDGNPLAWREWRRSRSSGMLRAAWGGYAVIGLLGLGMVVWPRPWNGPPGELPGAIGGFMVSIGLLLLGVETITSQAEDRARGGLDMLRLLPVTSQSILAAKWWASFRRAPALLVWPAAMGMVLAIRFGHWLNYGALLVMLPAYAAAAVSLALLMAVWTGRQGRAIGLFVTAYVVLLGVAPCLASAIVMVASRRHGLFALIGNPWLGTHLLTVGVAHAETVNSSGIKLGELARGVLGWVPVNLAFAWLVFCDACFRFEECLGGIPEWRRRKHSR